MGVLGCLTQPEGNKGDRRHELLTWALNLCSAFSLPTGVLEDSSVQHRPAVEKAKTLYRSCMNQSEYTHTLLGPSQLQHQGTR